MVCRSYREIVFFKQDNPRPHAARISVDYLQQQKIFKNGDVTLAFKFTRSKPNRASLRCTGMSPEAPTAGTNKPSISFGCLINKRGITFLKSGRTCCIGKK